MPFFLALSWLRNVEKRGQEVIWPGVGQTIFLLGPLGDPCATKGTSGDWGGQDLHNNKSKTDK